MPIYAYRCSACGHAQDVLQKISDPLLTICPACGQATYAKQVTAAGFQLKGSGWYVTDFRDGHKGAKPGADKAAEKADDKGADKGADKSVDKGAVTPAAPEAKLSDGGKSGAASPAASPAPVPAPSPAAPSAGA